MSLRAQYPICKMCHYLQVSPSAYYQWRNRKKTKRELENDLILKEIRKIHADKLKETYGVIRLQRELSALNMATSLRGIYKGLIFHSDQGSQYRSNDFRNKISDHGFIQSMSRKGNCWDNACAEAFFKTIKTEVLNGKIFNRKNSSSLDSGSNRKV